MSESKKLKFEVTVYLDALKALKSALKGELDLKQETVLQLNQDYDNLCNDISEELFPDADADLSYIMSKVSNLGDYFTADTEDLSIDYDEIDPFNYDILPVRIPCEFDLKKFKADFEKDLYTDEMEKE